MRPIFFILICVLVIIVIVLAITNTSQSRQTNTTVKNEAVSKKAVEMYQNAKEQGTDLSNGPCLGSVDNYAVDIAHTPREAIDNAPENQCPDFISGKLKHFIEITPFGTILRIK